MALKKNWISKHMVATMAAVGVIFVVLIVSIYYWQYSSLSLIDQIARDSNLNCFENVPVKAINKYSGEVREFPNSCQFPRGWEKVSNSQSSVAKSGLYKNEDYGFQLGVTSDVKRVDYQYNGKVDYVSVFLADSTKASLTINPKGGQDLLLPDTTPKESGHVTIGGKGAQIKKWDLPDGRTLVRYIFTDAVENWSACANPEKPTTSCNRIDILSSNVDLQNKLVDIAASMTFFKPVALKTSNTVYYYADNKLHIYTPSNDKDVTKSLPGLENYASIKKVSDDQLVYLSQDSVAIYDVSAQHSDILFAKNTENDITYIPDNYVLSPDHTKIAIGYRYGSAANVNNCTTKCTNVKVGMLVLDLSNRLTKASFDLPQLGTPVAWVNQTIAIKPWSGSGYVGISETGQVTSENFALPGGTVTSTSIVDSTKTDRIDLTNAVDIRTQQDRYGSASYLFVNGKVVYKGAPASINLVVN